MERFSWLAEKEVVNICDGKCLGCIYDLEFDVSSGCICALLVPECNCKWNVFAKSQYYRIPWSCIKQIGDDIILIEVSISEILLVE